MAQTKTLFFITESVPSDKDKAIASKIEGKVCFRNSKFIVPDANTEECDFVLGKVPDSYRKIPFYGSKKVDIKKPESTDDKKKEDTKTEVKSVWTPN